MLSAASDVSVLTACNKFAEILIGVVVNKADKLPGFESVNQVQLHKYLRQALDEVNQVQFFGCS